MKSLIIAICILEMYACTQEKPVLENEKGKEENWPIYVSYRLSVDGLLGPYAVYRCHYCNPKESLDYLTERKLQALVDSISFSKGGTNFKRQYDSLFEIYQNIQKEKERFLQEED